MIESDKKQFADIITEMIEAYGREITVPGLRGYWRALEDLPLSAVTEAITHVLRTEKWPPAPSELRQFTLRIVRQQKRRQQRDVERADLIRYRAVKRGNKDAREWQIGDILKRMKT